MYLVNISGAVNIGSDLRNLQCTVKTITSALCTFTHLTGLRTTTLHESTSVGCSTVCSSQYIQLFDSETIIAKQ